MEILFNFFNFIKINVDYNFYFTFLIFFIFLLFYNTFAIPGSFIFISATGYFFGIYLAYFIGIFTLVFGSFIFFSFSTIFFKKLFPKIINNYTVNIQNYISKSSLEYLIIFRMIPGPPLFLQNLLLSLINIKKINFIISSFIGFSPLVFVSVYVGHQLKEIDNLKNISFNDIFSFKFLIFIFCIIIFLLIRIFYKKK